MILDELYGSVIYEQNIDIGDQDQEQIADPPEFMPLKQFYLLEKIRNLKAKLEDQNISSHELDIILKFGNDFSYDTLVRLVDGIMDILKVQLQPRGETHEKR